MAIRLKGDSDSSVDCYIICVWLGPRSIPSSSYHIVGDFCRYIFSRDRPKFNFHECLFTRLIPVLYTYNLFQGFNFH